MPMVLSVVLSALILTRRLVPGKRLMILQLWIRVLYVDYAPFPLMVEKQRQLPLGPIRSWIRVYDLMCE
jgi:hypothetical protein